MTNKDNLQKELKEKIKAGIKPSHLRKSKSLDNIPTSSLPNTPLQKSKSQLEIPTQQSELAQLADQVKFHAETSQNYLASLQTAQAKITDLETELTNQIEKLTSQKDLIQTRLETIVREKNSLQAETQQWNIIDAQQRVKISEQLVVIKNLEQKITAKSEKEKQVDQLEEQILELRLSKIKEFGDYYEKKKYLASELELNINEGTSEIKQLESNLIATNKKKLELQQKLSQEQLKNTRLELKMINHPNRLPSFNYWPWLVMMILFSLSLWLLTITN